MDIIYNLQAKKKQKLKLNNGKNDFLAQHKFKMVCISVNWCLSISIVFNRRISSTFRRINQILFQCVLSINQLFTHIQNISKYDNVINWRFDYRYFWSKTFLCPFWISCDYWLTYQQQNIIKKVLCFISVIYKHFIWMVIGRFIFGLFESSGFVAESYYINKWFKGKENSLAFGIDTAICRLGSIGAAIIYPYLYLSSNNELSQCLLMCLLIAIISLLIIIILTQIDRCSDIRDKTTDSKLDSVDLRQIKNFNQEFYITLITAMTCYSVFFIFCYNSVEMFKNIYKLEQNVANTIFSIPYYLSAILSPIVGHYVDKKGNNIEILCIASGCQLLTMIIFYLMPECDIQCVAVPLLGSILNGFFFGTYYAVMWPHIPLIVPTHMVGTGFGLTFASINSEITIFSYIISNMLEIENYDNYRQMNFLLLILSVIGFIPLIFLFKYYRTQYHKRVQDQNDENESTNQIELIVKSKST
ncbi:unnamed protein product [Paramecium sonneborni]|uniref:Uncharacterized protein n=1 Tax=Paramecium sonneborni TaxID=65129 RepID=A0A8S1N9I9_9CILI|nr:unnamed protein product [Paramecium sonneborni]